MKGFTEITPGDRSHDALEVVLESRFLEKVCREQDLGQPAWAVCEFTDRKKPLLRVLRLGKDLDGNGAVINLLAANLFTEDGTRLSKVTVRRREERVKGRLHVKVSRKFEWVTA